MKRIIYIISILLILSVQINAQKLTSYAKQHQQEMAERQRMEKIKYDNACARNSLDVYKSFLQLYPKGKYSDDVRNRIADYELWNKAKTIHTIDSYNQYKKNSVFKLFIADADEAIESLHAIYEWIDIQFSTSIPQIQAYLNKYPKSPKKLNSYKRIHELKGMENYKQKNYVSAYREFLAAGGRSSLEYKNITIFDECQEYVEYTRLSNYSSERDLMAFLNKYPSSKFRFEISNKVAVRKALNFTRYSTDYTYNDALRYAMNDETRYVVKKYIQKNKRKQRHQRVMSNGGYVKLGIGVIDFGSNALSTRNKRLNVYYNIPVTIKLGNYSSPVQFEVGIMPGAIMWYYTDEEIEKHATTHGYNNSNDGYSYRYSYDYDNDNHYSFHMPVFTRLKLNLYKVSPKSRLYIAGTAWYNVLTDDMLENEISIGGGIGFAWKHWDWYTYYKQDLENTNKLDDKFISTSFIYYF